MDDEVMELTKVCAEVMGVEWCAEPKDGTTGLAYYLDPSMQSRDLNVRIYDPASDPAQAFELLCWLAERGCVHFEFGFRFEFYPKDGGEFLGYPCTDATELRLALMRATVKVHEGRGK